MQRKHLARKRAAVQMRQRKRRARGIHRNRAGVAGVAIPHVRAIPHHHTQGAGKRGNVGGRLIGGGIGNGAKGALVHALQRQGVTRHQLAAHERLGSRVDHSLTCQMGALAAQNHGRNAVRNGGDNRLARRRSGRGLARLGRIRFLFRARYLHYAHAMAILVAASLQLMAGAGHAGLVMNQHGCPFYPYQPGAAGSGPSGTASGVCWDTCAGRCPTCRTLRTWSRHRCTQSECHRHRRRRSRTWRSPCRVPAGSCRTRSHS